MDAAHHETSDVIADGEVVWSWRSDAGAKVVKTLQASHGRRWQPSMVSGEITYKPQNHCAGKAVGGFNRSSQHSRYGGCDEHSKEAINTGPAGPVGATAGCRSC